MKPTAQHESYPTYRDSGVEWLGQIPAHWDVQRLKTVADVRPSGVDKNSSDDETPVQLCNYTDVYYNDLITSELEFMEATATAEEIRRFELVADDVLITKDSETRDDIAVPAYVPESLAGVICGYHLALIRPQGHCLYGRYLFRAFSAYPQSAQFEIAANGITRFGLSASAIGDSLFVVPPYEEQRAIADFLDRETARLDALIDAKRRLIALLEEKRAALISHVVTKGLDPSVPMRDSGIAWLGEIPAHWDVKRLKFIAQVRSGVAKGRRLDGHKTLEVPYLRVANVQDGYLDLTDVATIEILENEIERYALRAGDILMNEGGDYDKLGRGAVWTSEIDPCIHQNHVFAVRPFSNEDSEWINAITSTDYAKFYFMIHSKQSTNLASISSTNIQNLPVVFPPLEEQLCILKNVSKLTANLDTLRFKVEEAISRLEEYRTALIAAAVTGKIDVRKGATIC